MKLPKTVIRLFLLISAGIILFPAVGVSSNVGKRYPSEKYIVVDQVTGRMITVLTSSQFSDGKPYHTHETWTADGKWIVFGSARGGNGLQIFVVNEMTGDIVQLTDYPGVQATNLSRKEMKLFYIRREQPTGNRQVIELNIGALIADSMSDQLKNPVDYERVVCSLPADRPGGEMALDADETHLYWGGVYFTPERKLTRPVDPGKDDPKGRAKFREDFRAFNEEAGRGKSEINKINIKTGKIDKVIDISFHQGHLQANPWKAGEMFYCKETGGDADQRIWSVNANGTGNRPIYVETPDEWVTHETVTSHDEMMFIISGHDQFHREKPSGIAVINLRTNQVRLLGEAYENSGDDRTGGFWHCNGSPDGRWAVGDTHLGNIILIDRATGEQILLSAGHPMRPDHAHPIFSSDSKRVLIQSGLLTEGKVLNLMVLNIP